MIFKFLSKLKSLFKSSATADTPLKKSKKIPKSSKTPKTKTKKITKAKTKSKKVESKTAIENLTSIPGVGQKSAEALYQAGFKTTKSIISASEKDLLAVPGVGINLVKKIKKLN